jgi:hypothetical protein
LTFGGFLALVNIDEYQAMPWQTYRANMGINTIWRSRRLDERVLPDDGSFILELGFFHESDHAASVDAFRDRFLLTPGDRFDNGNFSAYEYFKLRLRYEQRFLDERVALLNAIGGRFFTPSFNPGDRRELLAAFNVETRGSFRLVSRLFAFLGIYYELVGNRFSSAANDMRYSLEETPLHYLIVETGFSWRSRGGHSFQISFLYSRSHGRGLDFTLLRPNLGLMIRGQL